jgi:hypothetical protein
MALPPRDCSFSRRVGKGLHPQLLELASRRRPTRVLQIQNYYFLLFLVVACAPSMIDDDGPKIHRRRFSRQFYQHYVRNGRCHQRNNGSLNLPKILHSCFLQSLFSQAVGQVTPPSVPFWCCCCLLKRFSFEPQPPC